MKLSRRKILSGLSAVPFMGLAQAQSAPDLRIVSRVLDVKGKAAKVYGIIGPNGKSGLEMVLGQPFRFNLKNEIDDALLSIFDALSIQINDFYYGRYDILCASVADLKVGKNFSILEYNGCGAEPNHFYDTGYTLGGAYKEILKHWKALYEISKLNRVNGVEPWSFMKGFKFRKWTRDLISDMKKLDEEING